MLFIIVHLACDIYTCTLHYSGFLLYPGIVNLSFILAKEHRHSLAIMDSDNKSEVAPPQHELQSYTGIVDIDDKQAIVGKEIVNQEPGHGESGKKSGQRERKWTTALFVVISSIPALLVGCTLGFPSAALLDLTELEERPDFILNTVLSDVFGVSSQLATCSCHSLLCYCYGGSIIVVESSCARFAC